LTDRFRRAKRADRPRADSGRPSSQPARETDADLAQDPDALLEAEDADDEAALDAEAADQEAQLDAAADELRESGVAHKIASGDRKAVIASAPAAPPAKPDARDRTRAATAAAPAPTIARRTETLPYVDDRVSKVWVALVALAFAAVFAYALLGGQAGLLTRTPSPSPSPSLTVSPSASPSGSASASPSAASPRVSASP
jgi:hypothetical protein